MPVRLGVAFVAVGVAVCACTSSPDVPPDSEPLSVKVTPVSWDHIPVPRTGAPLQKDLQRGGALRVELIVHSSAEPNSQFRFTVRLTNVSSDSVSLSPCPPYRVQLGKVVEAGLLNCSDGPQRIAPNDAVDFSMEVNAAPYLRRVDFAHLLWQLGSEGDEGPTVTAEVPVAATP